MKKEDYEYSVYYLQQLKTERDECCHARVTMHSTEFSFCALVCQMQYTQTAVDSQ